jgi:hypothetical protein
VEEEKKERMIANNEIYHICVEQDTRKHAENCQQTQEMGIAV